MVSTVATLVLLVHLKEGKTDNKNLCLLLLIVEKDDVEKRGRNKGRGEEGFCKVQ